MFLCFLFLCSTFCTSSTVKLMHIEPVTAPIQHAEGPHWKLDEMALYFVDTFEPKILKWDAATNQTSTFDMVGNSVGMVIPMKYKKGEFIVGCDRQLYHLLWDGTDNSGVLEQIGSVDLDLDKNQFNDGKVDLDGQLWAGTLTRKDDLGVAPGGGRLYTVNHKNLKHPQLQLDGLNIPNGMAWSQNNKYFYFVDSEDGKIFVYDFDATLSTIRNQRVLFDLEHHTHLKGIPDGMTIDSDDNLWVALFGGSGVIQINSRTQDLMQVVNIPATYVTSVTFGGPNYDVLYVTTSKLKLTDDEAQQEPHAGSVFAVHNLGVRGLPANEFLY